MLDLSGCRSDDGGLVRSAWPRRVITRKVLHVNDHIKSLFVCLPITPARELWGQDDFSTLDGQVAAMEPDFPRVSAAD